MPQHRYEPVLLWGAGTIRGATIDDHRVRPTSQAAGRGRARSLPVSRRALLALGASAGLTGAVFVVARTGADEPPVDVGRGNRPTLSPSPTTDAPQVPRRLSQGPPSLVDPLVVDLSTFNTTLRYPGWDGSQASQATTGMFPQDRDLMILGHESTTWTGGGFIRGGRNIHWIGGAYDKGPWMRNFTGDGCMEGVLTRSPFDPNGAETGDGVSLLPDPSTLGQSEISFLNCRVEGIDGFLEGSHGDCFQLPSAYDPPDGYSSTPRRVTIERFTGSTGYQGFFLSNQHFDRNGYTYSCELLTLSDVNLKKTRAAIMQRPGVPRPSNVRLLFMADMVTDLRGDRPYPKQFANVYLEPWADEGLDGCIFPDSSSGRSPATGTPLAPNVSPDGLTATFPAQMLVDGRVNLGAPPEGDFAREADITGRGGLDIPGIGYQSPGYA